MWNVCFMTTVNQDILVCGGWEDKVWLPNEGILKVAQIILKYIIMVLQFVCTILRYLYTFLWFLHCKDIQIIIIDACHIQNNLIWIHFNLRRTIKHLAGLTALVNNEKHFLSIPQS